MLNCLIVAGFWIALCSAGPLVRSAGAQARIDVGIHDLLPDMADQHVTLDVELAEQFVRGMNVRAELGDGMGPLTEPVFEGADFNTTVWGAFPITTLGGAVAGAEQFLQASVNFSETGKSVIPNGSVVTLRISTLGIHEGVYPLTLSSETIGEDTDLILPGGATMVPVLIDGQVRIVPEPNGCLAVLLSAPWLMLVRRRRAR